MAYPFFSGQIPQRPKSDEGLTTYEIYHRFLLAYPAYTIDTIENELSWRIINEMLGCWEDEPPVIKRISRIERMLEIKFGFKKTKQTPLSSDQLVSRLIGEGLL